MRVDTTDIFGRPMTEWYFERPRRVVRYWRRASWRPFAFRAYGMVNFGAFGHCFQVMRLLPSPTPRTDG